MSATALILKIGQDEVSLHNEKSSETDIKKCEDKIIAHAKQLVIEKDAAGIQSMLISIRPFYELIGKARASKVIRELVELCLSIDQGNDEKISMMKMSIEWATTNHREFLRRNLQSRLVKLYNDVGKFTDAQKLAHSLVTELRKLDDRELFIEVSLEESRSAFNLNNFAKAKCSLVAAKTSANGSHVTGPIQAAVDLQSGILYSAEEKDFKTSYSYFYEAFEGYFGINDKSKAATALKYMLLCKIMLNEAEQIPSIMVTKEISTIKGEPIDAIRAMADSFRTRSLKSFQKALKDYKVHLVDDKVVSVHSQNLQRNMLEKEISRLIEPYSEIELDYVARAIGMTVPPIEKAISRMILDKKMLGSIDQRSGTVIIYPAAGSEKVFQSSLATIKSVSKAVDASYGRASDIK